MAKRKLEMYKYTKEQLYQAYIVNSMTLDELSLALKCSKSRLSHYLDELGIKKNKRIADNVEEISKLYLSGKSAKEIAQLYSCDESTVSLNLRKNGIPPKKKKVSNEERKKAYQNTEFMNKVIKYYAENEYLFKIYSNLSVKYGGVYGDCYEYMYNEFFTYCVTEERLNNFKKYSLRNYLSIVMRHYLYRVFDKSKKEKQVKEEKKDDI